MSFIKAVHCTVANVWITGKKWVFFFGMLRIVLEYLGTFWTFYSRFNPLATVQCTLIFRQSRLVAYNSVFCWYHLAFDIIQRLHTDWYPLEVVWLTSYMRSNAIICCCDINLEKLTWCFKELLVVLRRQGHILVVSPFEKWVTHLSVGFLFLPLSVSVLSQTPCSIVLTYV
jgi:hypothetical protein